MKRAHWLTGIAVLLVLAFVYRQQIVLRVVGIKPFFPERRVVGWVAKGADPEKLDQALRNIYDPDGEGPGSWVHEFAALGAEHEAQAAVLESSDSAAAADEYALAALYYGIARFPYVGSPAKEDAYQKHIQCYLTAAEHFNPPLEIVRIPFEGKEIIGYLRIPPADTPPPVVVITGGVDTWKSDVETSVNAMLAEGMATFSFDMPGTGESAWPLSATGDRIYAQVLDYLQTRPDVDGDRMAVYLRSFAGYFAVKLALTNDDVKAAVNVGGPIALAFTREHAEVIPIEMFHTVGHAMGVDPDISYKDAVPLFEALSLDTAGLLQPPVRQAPLLSINGDQDVLVPIADLYIISERGIEQEEWVYAGDGHTAGANAAEHIPKSAAWIKARLDEVPVAQALEEVPAGA